MAKTVKKAPPKASSPKSASAKASSAKSAAPKKVAQAPKSAKAANPKIAAKAVAPKKAAQQPKTAKAVAPKASAQRSSSVKTAAPKSALKKAAALTNNEGGKEPMLEKLFYDELKDIYYAEKLLVRSLPRLRKAATTDELKNAFDTHINVTKEQVSRLEQVFQLLGKKAQAKKCEAMEGLAKEAEGIVEETEAGSMTRDVGLIIAAQKVEHYEIATYGSLAQLAKLLGYEEIKNLLGQTLDEEKQADELLSQIAESKINSGAESEDDEAGQEEDEVDTESETTMVEPI